MHLAVLLFKSGCSPIGENQIRKINGIMPVGMTYQGNSSIPPAPHFMWVDCLQSLEAASEIAAKLPDAEKDWCVGDNSVVLRYQGVTGQHTITFSELMNSEHQYDSIWKIKGELFEILEYVPASPTLTEFQQAR